MIPLGTNAPRHGRAPVTLGLILACTAVFVIQAVLPDRAAALLVVEYGLVPRRFADPAWAIGVGLDPRDRLAFLSMAFLHGGGLHLLLNMWTLWLFGRAVEGRMGSLRYGVFYAACGLLASFAHYAVYPGSMVPTIGASGAIAGVLGAHASLFPRARVILLIPILIIPLFVPISALWYVAVWIGLQLVQGWGALGASLGGGVAWWAHIGGFFAGLVAVRLLTPPHQPPHRPPPRPPGGPPISTMTPWLGERANRGRTPLQRARRRRPRA